MEQKRMKVIREKYAEAKYFVYSAKPYPCRVGHIVGANRTYQAESGANDLGYFKTLKAATQAIAEAAETTE